MGLQGAAEAGRRLLESVAVGFQEIDPTLTLFY